MYNKLILTVFKKNEKRIDTTTELVKTAFESRVVEIAREKFGKVYEKAADLAKAVCCCVGLQCTLFAMVYIVTLS